MVLSRLKMVRDFDTSNISMHYIFALIFIMYALINTAPSRQLYNWNCARPSPPRPCASGVYPLAVGLGPCLSRQSLLPPWRQSLLMGVNSL